jgi:hypothetical protein
MFWRQDTNFKQAQLKAKYSRKCSDCTKDDVREHWWNYITTTFVIHIFHPSITEAKWISWWVGHVAKIGKREDRVEVLFKLNFHRFSDISSQCRFLQTLNSLKYSTLTFSCFPLCRGSDVRLLPVLSPLWMEILFSNRPRGSPHLLTGARTTVHAANRKIHAGDKWNTQEYSDVMTQFVAVHVWYNGLYF